MVSSYFLLVLATGLLSVGLGQDMPWIRNHWQVSLQVNGEHYCSGSLYSEAIIITAAHCFYKRLGTTFYRLLQVQEIAVLAGTYFKRDSKIRRGVSAIKPHEQFRMSPNVTTFDIGIMKSDPFKISYNVIPIPLAEKNPEVGEFIYSNGWHLLEKPTVSYVYPELRQWRYLRVESHHVCEQYLHQMPKDLNCAANFSAPLFGDPGSPLVYNYELVGVISGGYASGQGPVFYTSVPYYHSWLKAASKSFESS